MRPDDLITRIIAVAAGILMISGCAVTPIVDPASIVQVNQTLEIPDRKARVYIQNGAVTAKREVDPWEVYCSVLMQNLHARGEPKLTVSPGQFEIIRERKYEDPFAYPGTFVASRDMLFYPPVINSRIEMRLNSTEQPGVRALICNKQVEEHIRQFPTLTEIRKTLGNLIEIKTP